MATLIYRGPLERSRLGFLLGAAATAYGCPLDFVWLQPQGAIEPKAADYYLSFLNTHRHLIQRHRELDGRPAALVSGVRSLRQLVGDRRDPLIAFGFTALWAGAAVARGPFTWVINGLPEQRLLHRDAFRDRAYVRTLWIAARAGRRPDLTVVVSDAMGHLVSQRLGQLRWFAAPSCVDHATFQPSAAVPDKRQFLTYVGSGAPWQDIDLLAGVFAALAVRSPELRFRLISRDSRVREMASQLPEQSVELRSATEGREVAELLWEARAAFILRRGGLVNSTSTPAKFAEYVAAGAPVVATDIGWDLGETIRRTGAGLLVSDQSPPGEIAGQVLEFLAASPPEAFDEPCRLAAMEVDRDRWRGALAEMLARNHSAASA